MATKDDDPGRTRSFSPTAAEMKRRMKEQTENLTRQTAVHLGKINDFGNRLLGKDDDAMAQLREKVEHKDDFQAKPWRCITNPDRAQETLGPYARLEIVIQAARNLQPRDSWTGVQTLDPCVGVFVDDIKLESPSDNTLVVRATTSPLWQHKMAIDVVCPMSFVRLQVYDDQITTKLEQGFVEFCIGDIPYETSIAGWMELRFQDNLKNDSLKRYSSHCAMREDELGIYSNDVGALVTQASESKIKSNVSSTVTAKELKARKRIGERALLKTRTMMHTCTHSCVRGSGSSSPPGAEHDRGNAGELYVQMRLVKCVNERSSMFALALDPPPAKNYGDYVLQEDAEAGTVRRSLDLQKCMDVVTDMRIRLGEDFLFCLYYYFWYVCAWRSVWISGPVFFFVVLCSYHMYYMTIVWPGIFAFMLFLNSWENLRKNMTRGGWNAMITDDGFKRVAAWKKTGEMFYYLKRIVENDMNGSVSDVAKLRVLASKVARDGYPLVTLDELRKMLKKETGVITFDAKADSGFTAGDKVTVDERHMATVLRAVSATHLEVVYDEHLAVEDEEKLKDARKGAEKDKTELDRSAEEKKRLLGTKKGIPVEVSRVRRRKIVQFWQSWLLPSSMSNIIMDVMVQADTIQNSSLLPLIELLTDIVCWKRRKCIALGICSFCAILCALFVHTELTYEHEMNDEVSKHQSDNKDEVEETVAWMTISLLRNLDNIFYLGVVFACFVFPARWFVSVRSILKIAGRVGSMKRSAPQIWPFFREDAQLQSTFDQLMPQSEWSPFKDIVGQASLPMPDFDKLRQQMAGIKGMAGFKLPDLTHPSNKPTDKTDRPT
mmetsp:Transcript_15563/g.43045  ORF Transcript_15563/g.43045 Transcript_15563/m.43045 type:complete len:832 (+) Transcript_15563:99-2594(+)